jgi:deoxyribonuclease V
MMGILDVAYDDAIGVAALVLARDWTDAEPVEVRLARVEPVAEYVPGSFYARELPCLLAALDLGPRPDLVVIDGYVWLDDEGRKGLGARLHDATGLPVIGVAKTRYSGAPCAEVLRGRSLRPLYVGAAGVPLVEAAARVREMHGPNRIPTLLARADRAARDAVAGHGAPLSTPP